MTKQRQLTRARFSLPLTPPVELTPNRANARFGQYGRQAAAALMRKNVKDILVSSMNAKSIAGPLFTGLVEVDTEIYWGKAWKIGTKRESYEYRHRIDWDAAISSLKPVYDAFQDAGVIRNDRQLVRGGVTQDHDPDGAGYMVITIRALDGDGIRGCNLCNGYRYPAFAAGDIIGIWCPSCERLTAAEVE